MRRSLAGAAGALVLAAPAVAAAGAPAWRISLTVGPAAGWTTINTVAASGAGDGWAAGVTCPTPKCSRMTVVVEHWNGHGWRRLPAPPGGPVPANSAALTGASSASNAWVVTDVQGGTARADRWNGARWVAYRLPRLTTVDELEVVGPGNVWLFGSRGPNTNSTSYAARLDGRSWRPVHPPATVTSSTVSASGTLWALGLSKSAPSGSVLMRWTGRAWVTRPWPRLSLAKNRSAIPVGIVALGLRDVWVEYGVAAGGAPLIDPGLTQWNGRRWRRFAVPYQGASPLTVAQDGHGGLWLTMNVHDPSSAGQDLMHFSAGRWSTVPSPGHTGPVDLAWIPGTRSLWAGGQAGAAGVSPLRGVVLGYGT